MNTGQRDASPEVQYMYVNPIQLRYMKRYADTYPEDFELSVISTSTPDEVRAAAEEWSAYEERTYHDDEDAFDYIRRMELVSLESLLRSIPVAIVTRDLVKVLIKHKNLNMYQVLIDYYEPKDEMPADEREYDRMETDLRRVFGEDGRDKLASQIAHDNPSLSKIDILRHSWSLIPEATEYMMPASQEDLTVRAILIHEGYEAERRIS